MPSFRGVGLKEFFYSKFVQVNDIVVKWHGNGRRSHVPPVRPGSCSVGYRPHAYQRYGHH